VLLLFTPSLAMTATALCGSYLMRGTVKDSHSLALFTGLIGTPIAFLISLIVFIKLNRYSGFKTVLFFFAVLLANLAVSHVGCSAVSGTPILPRKQRSHPQKPERFPPIKYDTQASVPHPFRAPTSLTACRTTPPP